MRVELPDFPTPFCPSIAILNGRLLLDIDSRRNNGEDVIGKAITVNINSVTVIGL